MFYKRIIVGALVCIVAAPALAAASREENIGVGVGATLGGIAGGPLGAMLGVAVGAKLGEALHFRQAEIERLSGDLRASTNQVADLERTLATLESATHQLGIELQDAYANNHSEYLELLQAGIEMDLLFRTDEDVLSAGVEDRLAALAGVLAGLPAVNVSIEGYADERGASDYNLALSERRAARVQDLLVQNGVDPSRVFIKARGEIPAAKADADGYALQRRVSMKLFVGDAPALAANPL